MDDHAHDKKFFSQFGMVMAALFVIFGICIFVASTISSRGDEPSPTELSLIGERIQPFGTVVTDPSALVSKVASVAARTPLPVEQVLANACNACHVGGTLNSPVIGDTAVWQARLTAAGGVDELVASAIKGKNLMPARGGNPDLTDDEIRAAVEKMLADSGI